MTAFDIKGGVNGETAEEIFIIFNANEKETTVSLPEGNWNVYVNGEKAGTTALASISSGSAAVAPVSALVLVKEDNVVAPEEGADQEADSEESSSRESEASEASSQGTSAAEGGSSSVWMIVGIVAVVVLAAAGGVFVVLRKKK